MSKSNLNLHVNSFIKVKKILEDKSYGVEYQPFISTKNGEIEGYEALARFTYKGIPFRPDNFFAICHENNQLFFEAEYMIKQFQFINRPHNSKLFVNFDPHILLNKENINPMFNLFSKQRNFVIELVENSSDAVNTPKLMDIFRSLNFNFAADDFFKEDSKLSLALLKECDYLKLDIDTLKEMKNDKHFINIVEGLVKYSHALNKKVILEGVETSEDLALAKKIKIDYIQGFLFRSLFIKKMLHE